MLRGYLIYVLMFAVLGFGLWFVLRLGATLQAPAEIAGEWRVQWETASPTGRGFHGVMRVDQSGRYCTFAFDDARTMKLKMVDGTALGQGGPQAPLARLSGGGYQVTMHTTNVRDAVRLEISGRNHHRGLAERVNRPGEAESAHAPAVDPAPVAAVPVADARP